MVHVLSQSADGTITTTKMVLGEDEIGFATRGSLLIPFNVRNGKEVWHWDSNTPEIDVFPALDLIPQPIRIH